MQIDKLFHIFQILFIIIGWGRGHLCQITCQYVRGQSVESVLSFLFYMGSRDQSIIRLTLGGWGRYAPVPSEPPCWPMCKHGEGCFGGNYENMKLTYLWFHHFTSNKLSSRYICGSVDFRQAKHSVLACEMMFCDRTTRELFSCIPTVRTFLWGYWKWIGKLFPCTCV